MNLPPLTYLTFDSLAEGVGASQVLAYVERLADRGLDVRLHTFEKTAPAAGAGDLKKVGRVGVKAVLYFEVMTTLALDSPPVRG